MHHGNSYSSLHHFLCGFIWWNTLVSNTTLSLIFCTNFNLTDFWHIKWSIINQSLLQQITFLTSLAPWWVISTIWLDTSFMDYALLPNLFPFDHALIVLLSFVGPYEFVDEVSPTQGA